MLLSKSEKEFISRGILEDLRADGRGRLDYRPVQLTLNPIPQAIGSARLKIGHDGDYLVAIRAEISRPDPERPSEGTIQCSIDSSSSSLRDGDERSVQERNNLLSGTLHHILRNNFDCKQLCIIAGRHCWSLFVDVLILESDGNVLDAAVMASRAALLNTKLPGVSVQGDSEAEALELSDDPKDSQVLQCDQLPLAVTLCQIDSTVYFVDPSRSEEVCARSILLTAINPSGNISFLQKSSSASLHPSILADMISVAQSTAFTLFSQFSANSK